MRSVLEGEGRPAAGVSLILAGDQVLHELNLAWRGLDRPTDVLSFPAEPAPGEEGDYLGDVAVSLERALAQAPRFGADFAGEVERLVVHGLLHLLGYDHHTPAAGRRMKARERVYLSLSGRGA